MSAAPVPGIVAHRGHSLKYPENTLAAVCAAIDSGVHHVEVDVQLTADRVPVLFHDRRLERLCGVGRHVHELTMRQLRSLRVSDRERHGDHGPAEPIATLAGFLGVLARHPGVTAFIEVKRDAIDAYDVDAVYTAVWKAIRAQRRQCVLISFSLEFLAHARARQPDMPIALVVDRWQELGQPAAQALRAEYVFCDLHGLPPGGALIAPHEATLVVYEVADPELARGLAARGVHYVETFACAEMRQALRPAADV
ncbi:MAG: Glycerophosphodiester phosphodiesterase, cytoplasmic [Gammaproteobacteria bacterium]|nr:Glycerophosphodiester phosphodiesterase, cytoplasmic [Gammaproteobacteria bacterium]